MEWTSKSIMILIVLYTLLIMVFVLLCRKQKQLSDKFLILYAVVEIVGMTKYFAAFFSDQLFLTFPQYYFITIPVCYTYIPVFYLYFLSNFKVGFGLRRKQLIHFALFAAYLLYYSIRYLPKSAQEVQQLISTRPRFIHIEWIVHESILNIQYLIYSVLLILATREFLKNKPDLKKQLFLWPVLVTYLLGICVSLVFTGMAIFKINVPFDSGFWAIIYFYGFFIFLVFITIRRIESDKLRSIQKLELFGDKKAKELEKYVSDTVQSQHLFLDPELTLLECSRRVNLSEKELSFLLNHHLHENFNEYINGFRIERAKEMLIQYRDRTVQEIMYNSGFNSKAVFYAAFKKHTNLSPGDYRKGR